MFSKKKNTYPVNTKKTKKGFNKLKFLFFTVLSSAILPFFYGLLFYNLTTSCAQQQQLTGGPRDTIPPKLIKEFSTPNFQTNFEKQTIELAFDEFIEIRNVIKQVVISPPLTYIPKVERKKGFKTAQFKFDEKEVLKEGVTYAINFGESIKDLTEGNTVKDLQFLFSTGDYIDSLKMTGTILDALTSEPVPDALFMLYENFADTVVRTEKPYYFGKTDKTGKFTINYIKSGVFKGFALEDQDLNYLFNIPKERIGFTLDSIIITDSTQTEVQIRLFEEITTLEKPKLEEEQYGFVKMGFRRAPYDAVITYDSIGQNLYKEVEGDTIRYWYHLRDSIDWNFYFQRDTLIDTLKIRATTQNIPPIALTRERKADEKIPANPFKAIPIIFNHPIKNIDTNFINFYELIAIDSSLVSADSLNGDSLSNHTDSLVNKVDTTLVSLEYKRLSLINKLYVDSIKKRNLILNDEWKENTAYQVVFLPGAITDWYDMSNQDTISLTYQIKPKSDFGTINLIISEIDSTQNYWVQLVLGTNEVTAFPIYQQKEFKQSFPALLPGKYSLKIIEDLNANGRWDPGNYDQKLQAEKISTATIEELRAGWDVEATVKIDFEKKEKSSN